MVFSSENEARDSWVQHALESIQLGILHSPRLPEPESTQNSPATNMYIYPCDTPPTFTFSFAGSPTARPIGHETLHIGRQNATHCRSAIMGGASDAAGGEGHNLGDALMQNAYTTFDSGNSRVGFSKLA
ncbi:BQ2448_4813 [Microbotryum intermedium]|uniref:BQ2448_4813 protein n=1 Tax=Microbotryum intermedium TaxID=269621 RepID=A0A238FH48_9BASI|nr:BQ2448_4813 [Microbotryum intermedium]